MTLKRCYMSTKDWKTTKDTSNKQIVQEKRQKNETQEIKNTLQKSGGKSDPQKCQPFHEYEQYNKLL